ncbi:chloride channel protein [Sphingomonas sp. MJ1 (PH-R8)]|uniref:chloride channel protein n=1 Tax=Sphingomonas sp. MJ1 (PH-R8) TaxID=3112950 RepID=UPI003A8913AD
MPFFPDRARHLLRLHAQRNASDQWPILKRRVATAAGAVLLGLVALAFARASDLTQELFGHALARWPYAPLVATPLAFGAVVWATRRWARDARGSGIPQVIAAGRSADEQVAARLLSLGTAAKKLVLTVTMLLFGASVGREGPSVQVSAAIMVALHRLLRVPITAGVLIAGGAAGVAAAFNTPLAGVAFAIEELAAAYEQRVAVLVMGAVMIAGMVSLGIAGDYVYFGAVHQTLKLHRVLLLAPLAGLLGGVAGGLFTRVVLGFSDGHTGWARALKARPVLFAGLCGLVVAVLGVGTGGATWGTGYGATRALVEGGEVSGWFGPAKLMATLATTLTGAPGGIFAPSLAIGAGFGNLLTALFPYSPPGAVVVIGMVAYFVGVVRAPFTAVIIVSETTAARGLILPMFAAALIADWISARVCQERLYHGLARPFVAETEGPPRPAGAQSSSSS